MKHYTVKEVADLAGVSVRTLHYYDEIGLLPPTAKSPAGYRLYTYDDLLRLQQIMVFKELNLSLDEIQKIMNDLEFRLEDVLKSHRNTIEKRMEQFRKLLTTIDKTLASIHNHTPMSDHDIYEGFTPEQASEYRKEAAERWGEDEVRSSENRIKKMSKEQWNAVKAEGDAITQKLAEFMNNGLEPASPEVQECIARWHKFLENFYPVSEERLRGLGEMYVADERFKAFYEKYAKGLAEFKNKAIQIYCDGSPKFST